VQVAAAPEDPDSGGLTRGWHRDGPAGRAEWAPRVRCAARRAAGPASGWRSPAG